MKSSKNLTQPAINMLPIIAFSIVLIAGFATRSHSVLSTLFYFLLAFFIASLFLKKKPDTGTQRIDESEHNMKLRRLAYQDSLTGLPNRHKFVEILTARIDSNASKHQDYTLLFIDLDKFKQVNDNYGHAVGDEVLIESSNRIAKCLPHTALFSRLGGDEFVVLLENKLSNCTAKSLVNSIKNEVARPIALNGYEVQIGASVGLASTGEAKKSVSEILRAADMAMYQDKKNTKRRLPSSQQHAPDAYSVSTIEGIAA